MEPLQPQIPAILAQSQRFTKSIFISHAADDAELAKMIRRIVVSGMGVAAHVEVNCRSLDQQKVIKGRTFRDVIQKEVGRPQVSIIVLTLNYMNSPRCLVEAGLCWAASTAILPVIFWPLTFDSTRRAFKGCQMVTPFEQDSWNFGRDLIGAHVEIAPGEEKWNVEIGLRISEMRKWLEGQNFPRVVPVEQHIALQRSHAYAMRELGQREVLLEQKLEELISLKEELRELRERYGATNAPTST